jgi:5-methylcytosine-specific restriction endonuclease McrA
MFESLYEKLRLRQRTSAMNRRGAQKNADAIIDIDTLEKLINRAGMRCEWCGTRVTEDDVEIDHIFPFRIKSSNALDNLAISCPDCNRRKAEKHPAKFAQEQVNAGVQTQLIERILKEYDIPPSQQRGLFTDLDDA